jgi:Holliday junction resolvasome RuvABC endonuclease subunit
MIKFNILAIDQASNCGWKTKNAYGVWDFNTKKDESSGMKMLRFRSKLKEVCELEQINLIVYERVAGRHANSIIHASKMVAMIETFCEENNIEYKAVSATEVKKFATGKGNANKDKMIEAARLKYGYEGNDDNEADAILIYHHTLLELNL